MKLGCGLFGLAMELGEDFWGTMQKLADIGFTAVEPLYAFREDTALQPGSPVPSFLTSVPAAEVCCWQKKYMKVPAKNNGSLYKNEE